ncbi:TFIIB-type zinc ribbon-containing protein [Thiovibrio sp. JS02]
MKCPVCPTVDLLISERQGVEIDYCPQCRGVWLDRGELDKIIERSGSGKEHDDGGRHGGKSHREEKVHTYKKKSLLHDLFDF